MLSKYFVSRKAYDHDVNELRKRASELTKELREEEKKKAEARRQVEVVKVQMRSHQDYASRLERQIKKAPEARDIKEYIDPMPKGETARKEYVSQVAGFFQGGLRDKLNYMHLQFRNQTGMFPLTERETDFFRSCINVVGLLLDWGEECVAEHNANIAGANNMGEVDAFAPTPMEPEQEQAVKNIKKKIKKKK